MFCLSIFTTYSKKKLVKSGQVRVFSKYLLLALLYLKAALGSLEQINAAFANYKVLTELRQCVFQFIFVNGATVVSVITSES